MPMKPLECGKCGAPLERDALRCTYCGTLFDGQSSREGYPSQVEKNSIPIFNLSPGIGEFGFSNKPLLLVGFVVASGLYFLGWFFEDTYYWLDERAMGIWVGILPFWIFTWATLWRKERKTIPFGLVFSLAIFATHITIIWIIERHLWDDHFGIAAIVAGASLGSWILGRMVHTIIRWHRSYQN